MTTQKYYDMLINRNVTAPKDAATMFSRFLRKMPLWQVPLVLLSGQALIYVASLIGLGGRLYVGDTFALIGIALCFSAIIVATYGYLYAAMMGLLGKKR